MSEVKPNDQLETNLNRSGPIHSRRSNEDVQLIPARILNEFVYCPRLAYLEWVQKEWEDSSDTVEGRFVHRRVDKQKGSLPAQADISDNKLHVHSVELSSDDLNVVAKIDLLESRGSTVIPIEYKRGKRPHVSHHAYDTDRVQLCVQGLLLEEHGYTCTEGVLYFAGSRERVRVRFDEELRNLTYQSIKELRSVVDRSEIPPPLQDSPKCVRCSLVGICLPDEVNWLRLKANEIRPLSVKHTKALPVYIQSFRGKVAKEGERLAITNDDGQTTFARLADISQLVIMGNVYVTTPALQDLMNRNITVTWQSFGGWFYGHTIGTGHRNVELRTVQYKNSFEESICVELARGWVQAKIRNCRTLLRRNWRSDTKATSILNDLKRLSDQADRTSSREKLLGIEGAAAAKYFQNLPNVLRREDGLDEFHMSRRNRRPPRDPINALFSFGYSLLTRTFVVMLSATGFDPYRGFYHQPRYGRPALALDMMEPFRPLIVDSVVLTVINNGEVRLADFVRSPLGVNLTSSGRKKFIAAFERRLSHEVTHPLFGYRIAYRRLIEIQSRLLGRYLMGEIDSYPNFITR